MPCRRWAFPVALVADAFNQKFERTLINLYGDGDTDARQRRNIERAFPVGLVIKDPKLMAILTLPDPNDRHVLAAAM